MSMYKSQYDYDVTVWSPQGRLHQLEYACSAVDQGSVVLGLKSKTHSVLVGLRRTPNKELAYHTEKLFTIDTHIGIGVSGLISDGRRLCKYMINETLNYKYVFNKPMPTRRIVVEIADKQQVQTQQSSGRPFGVGLLIIGYDETGSHLYETDPSGQFFEYYAHAIGSRNQAAKTYLEKQFESTTFEDMSLKDLIQHGVNALKETVRTKDIKLTTDNVSVMCVGKDTSLYHVDEDELQPYIDNVEGDDNEENDDEESDDDDEDDDDNNKDENMTDKKEDKKETKKDDKEQQKNVEPMQVDS